MVDLALKIWAFDYLASLILVIIIVIIFIILTILSWIENKIKRIFEYAKKYYENKK
jgi:lipopolysaccharide/colanic/teichoic acid biosynthesis glycosyltransferase